ncbi:MAG: T9SS type A sorting domain-containing protein [Bacteroidia bacterium]
MRTRLSISTLRHVLTFMSISGLLTIHSLASAQQIAGTAKATQGEAVKNVEAEEDEDGERADRSMNCGGVERWSVKVLVDAAVSTINWTPVVKTTTQLAALTTPTPSTSMPRTGPVETTCYQTNCNITIKKAETDNDYHLVLSDGSNTVIGEIPDPSCSAAAGSAYVNQFIAARNFIDAHIASGNVFGVSIPPVTVTGVGFVDPPHGQTGAAPNNFEIHSITDIHFQSATGIVDPALTLKATVGPNPFTTSTEFQLNSKLNDLSKVTLTLFDMQGQIVREQEVPVMGSSQIDYVMPKGDLPTGIYFYRFRNNGAILFEGRIVAQ